MSQTEHERTNTVFIHGRSKCNMQGIFRTVHEVKTRQGKTRCGETMEKNKQKILSWVLMLRLRSANLHAAIIAFPVGEIF